MASVNAWRARAAALSVLFDFFQVEYITMATLFEPNKNRVKKVVAMVTYSINIHIA